MFCISKNWYNDQFLVASYIYFGMYIVYNLLKVVKRSDFGNGGKHGNRKRVLFGTITFAGKEWICQNYYRCA